MAETEFADFAPLFPEETEEAIRARWVVWANEGLVAGDERFVSTREGDVWDVCTRGSIRESAREYDRMGVEVVAAAFPQWSWGDYLDDHAERDGLARLAATFSEGEVRFTSTVPTPTPIAVGTVVYVPASLAEAELGPIEFETTAGGTLPGNGVLDLAVRARVAGSRANVGATAISAMAVGLQGVVVSNAAATVGGADTESDEALMERVLANFRGAGGANDQFYERIARDFPGVGFVTVISRWNGPNTVRVIIRAPDGGPTSAGTVDALQALLDPTPGLGHGLAPAGAEVDVETATVLNVTIAATIEFEPGFSLTGATAGTIALQALIERVVADYVNSVEPGGEVVRAQVVSRIAAVHGVHDVDIATVLLNGAAVNVAVAANPPKVPRAVTPMTLAEGTF